MILRMLGAILFGGGAFGAFAGWALCRYLDARRERLAQLMRRRSPRIPQPAGLPPAPPKRPTVPPPKPPNTRARTIYDPSLSHNCPNPRCEYVRGHRGPCSTDP